MKHPSSAFILCIIGCVLIAMGCGAANDASSPPTLLPIPAEQQKAKPPLTPSQTTVTPESDAVDTDLPAAAPPAAEQLPAASKFKLLDALTDSENSPSGKNVMRIKGSKQQYTTWHIQADGTVNSAGWMSYSAWNDSVSGYTGSGSSAPRETKHLAFTVRLDNDVVDLQNDTEAEPADRPAKFQPVYSLVATASGSLVTPDQGDIDGVYRVYAYGGYINWDIITFTPRNLKKHNWIIVISETMLSPVGAPQGVSRGDFDGDGQPDIAYVVEGVDGCDHPDCPLAWAVLLLSEERLSPHSIDALLFYGEEVEALAGRCSHLTYDFYPFKKFKWSTKIGHGVLDITYALGSCALPWHFQKTADGKIDKIFPAFP